MRIVWWQLSELLRKWAGACCPDERWLLLLYTLLLSRHINVASVASNSFHWTAAPMHNVLLVNVQYLFLAVVCRQFYSIPNNFCLRDKGKAFSNCYYWPVLQLPGGSAQQWLFIAAKCVKSKNHPPFHTIKNCNQCDFASSGNGSLRTRMKKDVLKLNC